MGAAAIHFARLSVLCLATLFVQPSLAANPKPDAAIKTKTIEGKVYLDNKIKADPALAADCLADAKKWLGKNAAEGAADFKHNPEFFRDGPWLYERKYSVRSVVGDRYVSIVRDDYIDGHGAHPNTEANTILWDQTAKKPISIRPFFAETADNGPTMTAMLKAVIAALKVEKEKRDVSDPEAAEWFKDLKPNLLKIGAVILTPSTVSGKSSGLTFYYPPYVVGPYSEGEYIAFVPWETLKPYLSAEGMRIFAGARPKGDEEQ